MAAFAWSVTGYSKFLAPERHSGERDIPDISQQTPRRRAERFRIFRRSVVRMIVKRVLPGKLPSVLFLMFVCIMIWLFHSRGNISHLSPKRSECPCSERTFTRTAWAGETSDNFGVNKVSTRTVIKWMNYCQDEYNDTRPTGARIHSQTKNETRKRSESRLGSVVERQKQRGQIAQTRRQQQERQRKILNKQQNKNIKSHDQLQRQTDQQQQQQQRQQQRQQQQQQKQEQQHGTQDAKAVAENLHNAYTVGPATREKVVNPHPFQFILTNSDACIKAANSNGLVDVVCLVYTAPSDSYMRWLIRKTWAGAKKVRRKRIVTMFLLGQTDSETQQLIELENDHYRDIIQENFTDSYYNLTLKTVMGFKWMAHYCTNARFVIKMDIDMFVNVYNLAKRVDAVPPRAFAEGNRKGVTEPIRYKQSKWYTPINMYPNSSYPPYLNGPAYLMSADLATPIYKMSFTTPFLPWEDAYVGIIMKKINVNPKYSGMYDTYLNYTNKADTLRKIRASITFHLGEDKNKNKANIVNVWKYVRKLNNLPV